MGPYQGGVGLRKLLEVRTSILVAVLVGLFTVAGAASVAAAASVSSPNITPQRCCLQEVCTGYQYNGTCYNGQWECADWGYCITE